MNPEERAENAESLGTKAKQDALDRRIIVDVDSQWTRVGLLEGHELAEVYFEMQGSERIVGNIYLGKVQNVLPGMQAAFVDIGQERNAFLYAGDILSDKSDLGFPAAYRIWSSPASPYSSRCSRSRWAVKGRGSQPTSPCPAATWCLCLRWITSVFPGGSRTKKSAHGYAIS